MAGVRLGPMPFPVAQACIIVPESLHSLHTQGGNAQRREEYIKPKQLIVAEYMFCTAIAQIVMPFDSSENKKLPAQNIGQH